MPSKSKKGIQSAIEATGVWKMCCTNKLGFMYFSHLAQIQMCVLCTCFAWLILIYTTC